MKTTEATDHYEKTDLVQRMKDAIAKSGLPDRKLTPDDLANLDQFHSRGMASTIELAEALNLTPGSEVVDIGSGLGGPSRYLAAKYGSKVQGIDLSSSFVDAATFLAERCGLSDLVSYQAANALALPFENESFDVAWTQHVAMNIADRKQLYAETYRVLRKGGRFAIYDVLSGGNGPIHFPVPWAPSQDSSFLLTETETRAVLEDAGFRTQSWSNKTPEGLEWFAQQRQLIQSGAQSPILGLQIAMGPEFGQMAANLGRNLQEGLVVLLEAIVEKP